ncbi:MAG TPA: hypothetical protein VHT91_12820 [Kofleriaceae bacterium]|jgi:hypothetical protein|nr:hypothetical protein [Kofleriaceae bacterium]
MTVVTWRNTALVLAAICGYQRTQSCTHAAAPIEPVASEARPAPATPATTPPPPALPPALPAAPSLDPAAAGTGKSFYGFHVPAWALRLAPQRGETPRAYRDRILPIAQAAIAPQRARVARTRDDFAGLDPHQRAELDGAVADATKAIQDRILTAFASGELRPATFKPMTGVAIARDVLDIVDRGNTRFLGSLTGDQRTELAAHRFDFADYLLFTSHWEDALK